MAVIQGVKEKVHLPIYDSVSVEPEQQLREVESTNTLKFFVNVQGKTKLETNLQSASLLPHYNTFEARAMRVVISDLKPEFPDGVGVNIPYLCNGTDITIKIDLARAMELLEEAREGADGKTQIRVEIKDEVGTEVETGGTSVPLTVSDLETAIRDIDRGKAPPLEQVRPNNGCGTIISKLIYNTVTTLYVGEKVMIQMPTWFFPSGAGPFSETDRLTTHGSPDPMATFRFAEPVFIDKQQNFRVEIEVPNRDVLDELQKVYGPFTTWVVLDGFMTRDVQ